MHVPGILFGTGKICENRTLTKKNLQIKVLPSNRNADRLANDGDKRAEGEKINIRKLSLGRSCTKPKKSDRSVACNLYLPSAVVISQLLVGPSKQLKQMTQTEHNIVKNPSWPEAN